jgi:hypothetical protein
MPNYCCPDFSVRGSIVIIDASPPGPVAIAARQLVREALDQSQILYTVSPDVNCDSLYVGRDVIGFQPCFCYLMQHRIVCHRLELVTTKYEYADPDFITHLMLPVMEAARGVTLCQ